MSGHTLGPWETVQNIVIPAAAPAVNTVNEVAYINGNNPHAGENINLIAAAPDMYDALEKVASGGCCQTEGCNEDHPMCDAMIARAAIAKARGHEGTTP